MSDFDKWTCDECGWQGYRHQILTARNPFECAENISGCPECRTVERFTQACDEPDCWLEATSGTPFGEFGYKRHCHKHPPADARLTGWKKP